MIHPSTFFRLLQKRFPKLKKVLLEWGEELPHARMENFSHYTVEKIKQKKWRRVQQFFDFIAPKIKIATDELLNVLNVSYCETLYLCLDKAKKSKKGKKMRKCMPKALKKMYLGYKAYYISLGKK